LGDCPAEVAGLVAWDKLATPGRPMGLARRTIKPVKQAAIEAKKLRRLTSATSSNSLTGMPASIFHAVMLFPFHLRRSLFSTPFMAHMIVAQLTCSSSGKQL
jgi:hypothetical protein